MFAAADAGMFFADADRSGLGPARQAHSVYLRAIFPYGTPGGWNEAKKNALADAIIAQLAEYAPNLRGAIEARQVLSPEDLESRFGLRGGHIFHGEPAAGTDLRRPVPGAQPDSEFVFVRLGNASRRLRERISRKTRGCRHSCRRAGGYERMIAAAALHAPPAHRFSIAAMQRIAGVSGAVISPDGSRVAFVVSRTDLEHNRYDDVLEIYDRRTRVTHEADVDFRSVVERPGRPMVRASQPL